MSDLAIWCQATELVREHGERAEDAAQRNLLSHIADPASEGFRSVLCAVAELLRALGGCRRPALYFRFRWHADVSDAELELEMMRHHGRTEFGFNSVDDLPSRGPLLILKAATVEAARVEAEAYWADRTAMGAVDAAPDDYSMFNEHGLICGSHDLAELVDPASTRWSDEEPCGLPCCAKPPPDMVGPHGGHDGQRP